MENRVDYVYDTRLRRQSLDTEFHSRLAAAFTNPSEDSFHEEDSDEESAFDLGDVEDDDFLIENEASDVESDLVIETGETFDSDSDDDEGEDDSTTEEEVSRSDDCYYGKDGTEWKKDEPSSTRIRHHNIMRHRGGPKSNTTVPIEVFKQFFTPNISFIIITETNRAGSEAAAKYNAEYPNRKPKVWKELISTELDAYIGILLASGVSHNNLQKSRVLWAMDALPIFRAAMSFSRFCILNKYVRFDNNRSRAFRQQTDKAAPIRDIWNLLNENLARNYDPYEKISVDEQLFPYRGRTKFTQYIPSKPAKYGIKVWWACDAKTKYPLHGKLYTGREEGVPREINQGENVLLQLTNRFSNSGRTIIADNFFTTLEGAKRLANNGLAFVGTIRGNKRCIPEEMRKNRSRPEHSTLFGFHEMVTICSYVPKKNKAVNLLSTVHYTKNCEGEKQKPEAILYYNSAKGGVDCMDQMVTHFSCKRSTKRWTLAFFFNMLDVMALAAYSVCKDIEKFTKPDSRRTFLVSLSNSLVNANIENRMNNARIMGQFSARTAIECYFGRKIWVSNNIVQSNFIFFGFR